MAEGALTVGGIPQIGYGTWNRSGRAAREAVLAALEIGYRHIDTAQGYNNEHEVGAAIAESGLRREDVFITTKVKPDNYGPGAVVPSVRRSLEKLRIDKADLLLLHWPSPNGALPLSAYVPQLGEALDAGLTAMIGVSNFTIDLITQAQDLLGGRRIAANQVEMHVYMQNRPIVEHCKSQRIAVTAYSPLARGQVVGDAVLTGIGRAHGVGAAEVALAFLLARGVIVIPSAGARERIASNFHARLVSLSGEEISRIAALEEGRRLIDHPWCPTWDE